MENLDGKSYKNALRINTILSRTKRRKSLSLRSKGTASVKKNSHIAKIKQEMIDDKGVRKDYAPVLLSRKTLYARMIKIRNLQPIQLRNDIICILINKLW